MQAIYQGSGKLCVWSYLSNICDRKILIMNIVVIVVQFGSPDEFKELALVVLVSKREPPMEACVGAHSCMAGTGWHFVEVRSASVCI